MPRSQLPRVRFRLSPPPASPAMGRVRWSPLLSSCLVLLSLLAACNDDCPAATHLRDGRCVSAETSECEASTCDAGQGGSGPDGSMAGQAGGGMDGNGGQGVCRGEWERIRA